MNQQHGSSYGQILKSSSIVGGGEAVSQLIGLIRTKAVAVLLGPSGMGLVNLYISAVGLVGLVAQLGINQSGVRAVAEAQSQNDPTKTAQVVTTLRRACWLTGCMGWILVAICAQPLSMWVFDSAEHTWAFAILGSTILIMAVSSGQTALLNGMRRIGDLARIQIYSALASTLLAVLLYGALGDSGIVPVIILTSAIQLGVSWIYSRRISLQPVSQAWWETLNNVRGLVSLGLALMYTSLLVSVVGLVTRVLITRELGLDANGFYQSAWAISGMLATFILAAMGRDFYPRLSAAHADAHSVNKLVNEQIEIGILLGMPGLVAVIAFAPLLVELFYSSKFLPSAQLLPFFALGVFIRLISWPMGFILLAKSDSLKYALVASIFHGAQLGLTVILLRQYGLIGTAAAFILAELIQLLLYYAAGRHAVQLVVSPGVRRLTFGGVVTMGLACVLVANTQTLLVYVLSGLLTLVAAGGALRGLTARLPESSPIVSLLHRVPFMRFLVLMK